MPKVRVGEPPFEYRRVIGNIGKELIRTLLEGCGYTVYPFGYESYFTHVKDLIHTKKLEGYPVLQRMPDLLVIDEEEGKVDLVEVMTTLTKPPDDATIPMQKWKELKKFWPSSILVLVAPKGRHVFYAKKVTKLKITTTHDIIKYKPLFLNFDISKSPITKYFPKVKNSIILNKLQELCKNLFENIYLQS